MRKNQKGFALLTLCFVLILSLILIVGLKIALSNNNKKSATETSPTPAEVGSRGETRIVGTAAFTNQGPTDAPIGKEPTEATLLIGSEVSVRNALKPLKTDDGTVVNYSASESDIKSTNSRIITTTKGDYEFMLAENEDAACLVEKIGYQQPDGNFDNQYHILAGTPCVKFDKSKSKIQTSINLIGFGSNQLKCTPGTDCTRISLKYD